MKLHYLLIALILIDLVTTYIGLKHGAREQWATTKWLMSKLGQMPVLFVTHVATSVSIYLWPPTGIYLWIPGIVMTYVAIKNLISLRSI